MIEIHLIVPTALLSVTKTQHFEVDCVYNAFYFTMALMTNWFPQQRLINPTLEPMSPLLPSILEKHSSYKAFNGVEATDSESLKNINVILTHSWFTFEKPFRLSKSGVRKAQQTYISVYHPQALGRGTAGAVYSVECSLTTENASWVVKTKENKRVVKCSSGGDNESFIALIREQEVGQFIPHMGYRYAPALDPNTNQSYLLMNLIPGISMQAIIECCRNNPNYLNVRERLLITINLLKALAEQIHNNEFPQLGYVIHQDIKHANILVQKDWNIKYIDYGLSRLSHDYKREEIEGTLLYMDTLVMEKKCKTSTLTDYASVSRVIAELWGDDSETSLEEVHQLVSANKKNRMRNLLSGIHGLKEDEKRKLIDTINQMNRYQMNERLPRAKALRFFETFFNEYSPVIDPLLANRVQETPISDLTSDQLVELLNSDAAPALIARLKQHSAQFSLVISQLGHKIAKVHDAKLHQLKEAGCDFSTHLINKNTLQHYKAKQLQLLLTLGTKLDPNCLQQFLESSTKNRVHPIFSQQWVSVCQLLYAHSERAARDTIPTQTMDSTVRIFYSEFLRNINCNQDNYILYNSFESYLNATRCNEMLLKTIQSKLIGIKDTPLAAAIHSILLEFPHDQIAFTTYDILKKINNALCTIGECQKYLTQNKIEALEQKLNAMCSLNKRSIEDIFLDARALYKQLTDTRRPVERTSVTLNPGFFANNTQKPSAGALSPSAKI